MMKPQCLHDHRIKQNDKSNNRNRNRNFVNNNDNNDISSKLKNELKQFQSEEIKSCSDSSVQLQTFPRRRQRSFSANLDKWYSGISESSSSEVDSTPYNAGSSSSCYDGSRNNSKAFHQECKILNSETKKKNVNKNNSIAIIKNNSVTTTSKHKCNYNLHFHQKGNNVDCNLDTISTTTSTTTKSTVIDTIINRRRAFSQSETRQIRTSSNGHEMTTIITTNPTIPSTSSIHNLQLPPLLYVRNDSPTRDIVINDDENDEELNYYKRLLSPTTWRQSRLEYNNYYHDCNNSSRRRICAHNNTSTSSNMGIVMNTNNTNANANKPMTNKSAIVTLISTITKATKKISYYYYYYSKKKYLFGFVVCIILVAASLTTIPLQQQQNHYVDEREVIQLEQSLILSSSSTSSITATTHNLSSYNNKQQNNEIPAIVSYQNMKSNLHGSPNFDNLSQSSTLQKKKKKLRPNLAQANTLSTRLHSFSLLSSSKDDNNINNDNPQLSSSLSVKGYYRVDGNYIPIIKSPLSNLNGRNLRNNDEDVVVQSNCYYGIMLVLVMIMVVFGIMVVIRKGHVNSYSRRRLRVSGMTEL